MSGYGREKGKILSEIDRDREELEDLAMTGYDILSSDEFQAEIRRFHEQQIPDFYKEKKS